MRGLVTMALSDPAAATASTRARPLGTTETADWPLPSLALASIASGLLEPDPIITWDAERITRTGQTLDHLAAADIRSQGLGLTQISERHPRGWQPHANGMRTARRMGR